MSTGWYFPSNNYGTVTGIGEAGIETFRGSPYRSLAREICQNSMDARIDNKNPVIIEFSSFSIPTKNIPGYDNLHEAIKSCLNFWTEQDNKKAIDFFNKAKTTIEHPTIDVLRISDFNTTGLQGSDKEFNTPWHNLVKASGVSGKEGSAGGSFGIGKAAPFVCSDIRTLFYATKDIDGLSAFQGIAKLVSFREKGLFKERDSITSGTGFYSADKKNTPLRNCKSIDPNFTRFECGTDIFVVGFYKTADWKTEIISSVLEEFVLAIYSNELIVKIDNIEISSNNLKDIIEIYKEKAKFAYNYYQVLTNDNVVVKEHDFEELGTIELHILIKNGLHRKVMMCRKNGMKIFDKANISSTIQFAGICILKDDKINEYFRAMENPQHNAWEPERHSTDSKNKAKSNMTLLYKYIKNEVIELGKVTTVDEIDAEGMGEFFADTEFIDTDNQSKKETISNTTKNLEIKFSKNQKSDVGYEETIDGNITYFENDELFGGIGSKDRYDENPNLSHTGTSFGGGDGNNVGTNGSGDNSYQISFMDFNDNESATCITTMSVRLFIIDRENNIYYLAFVPKKNSGKGYLQINLSGEQSNIKTNIIEAKDLNGNTSLCCKGNKIYLNNIIKGVKNKVSFKIDYIDECSLEVKLYGYSS